MPHSTLVPRREGKGLDPPEMSVELGTMVAPQADIACVGAQLPVPTRCAD